MQTAPAQERPIETWFRPDFEVNLALTLSPLRHGLGDPTIRLGQREAWRATRTPLGPATIRVEARRDGFAVMAWGPGREWAIDAVPRLFGETDDPSALQPHHPRVVGLLRQLRGLRFGRSDAVYEALIPAILEQKVTGFEARASHSALIRAFGEVAPGPARLLLPPSPETLRTVPYHALHPLGIEARRAAVLARVAVLAPRLEEAATFAPGDALARLRLVPGVGPWTAAEAARVAFGDPDAVSVGDYHLPSLVSYALSGEPRGDDSRMLELLEPYRGQRARVVRLLELGGPWPPRRGPRMSPRSIAAL